MVGGCGADTWSSPCGGAPSTTQPTALSSPPFSHPLAVTAVRWGYREKLGDPHPSCIVGLCYNAQK